MFEKCERMTDHGHTMMACGSGELKASTAAHSKQPIPFAFCTTCNDYFSCKTQTTFLVKRTKRSFGAPLFPFFICFFFEAQSILKYSLHIMSAA